MNRYVAKFIVVPCVVLSLLFADMAFGQRSETTLQKAQPKKTPDCVFVPTPHDVVEKMLDMAKVTKGDVIYDLGCGDGRIIVQAAKKRGCKGVGFEIVPELAQQARECPAEPRREAGHDQGGRPLRGRPGRGDSAADVSVAKNAHSTQA